jgi:hypothetical protein
MSFNTILTGVAGTAGSMMMFRPLGWVNTRRIARRSRPSKSSEIGAPVYFFSWACDAICGPDGSGACSEF